jgi:nucleoside-diphosphate-sugar epimerase
MKVLVTGSSGFLGSHFMDYCLRRGDSVVGVDIKPDPKGSPGVAQMDLGQWLEVADRDFDLVIHMAAPVGGREKIEGDPLYNADSLRLDSLMFRWAVKHAKTMLFPSSSAVYGVQFQGKNAVALQEGMFSALNPNWFAPDEMYGFTKLVGERLAVSAAKYGLNTLCIRPFSGYGPGQSFEYPVPSIAMRAIRAENPIEVWGPGTQTRDFVYVDDIIGASMARLEQGVDGYETMNIGSGHATSFNAIAKICAKLCGYEAEVVNIADKPMGVMHRFSSNGRMLRYYTPQISLTEGLTRVLDYLGQ